MESRTVKIAVCMFGQIRTGVETSPVLLNFLGDMLQNTDFFIHTWDIETPGRWGLDVLGDEALSGVKTDIDMSKMEKIKNIYKPKEFHIIMQDLYLLDFKARITNKHGQYADAIPLFLSMQSCNLLRNRYETDTGTKYDLVITLRPDVVFERNHHLKDEIDNITDTSALHVLDVCGKLPYEVEDICWMSSPATMDIAVNFAEELSRSYLFRNLNWQRHAKLFFNSNSIQVKCLKSNGGRIYRYYHIHQGVDPFNFDAVV